MVAVSQIIGTSAFSQNLGFIRDAETEALVYEYTRPIFRAAGVDKQNITIRLVNDSSFNAFVVDGQNMFINTGAILLSETPNQLIGVIAHETGHIKGGHITQLHLQMEKMQTAALMIQLLSIGAAVGGAASGNSEAGNAGAALLYGGNQILGRSFTSYRRGQEAAADQAGVKYLTATKQSAAGMIKTFQYFADQSIVLSSSIDPYTQTHPVPRDRIATLQEIARKSPYFDAKDSAQLQLAHDLVRAKIAAYTYKNNPQRVMRQYAGNGLPDKYARTIVKYHTGGYAAAESSLNELTSAYPENPWFHELKGTFLLESGKAREAIAPLRKAASLQKRSGYIRIELAQALLEGGGSPSEVLEMLNVALISEEQSYLAHRLKSTALGKLNKLPEADLSAAWASFHSGDVRTAKLMAERAKRGLKPGSREALKAEEILSFEDKRQRG